LAKCRTNRRKNEEGRINFNQEFFIIHVSMKNHIFIQNAFSLLEMLLVVTIIGIFASVAVPYFGTGLMQRMDVYTSARQIASDLMYARTLAVNTNKNHILRFYPPTSPYSQYKIFRSDGGEVQVGHTRDVDANVTCTGDREHTFEPLGNATSDRTLSVTSGTYQYDVKVIGITGRVYVD